MRSIQPKLTPNSTLHPPTQHEQRSKRVKIETACDLCRQRKVKCDGVRPDCGPCNRNRKKNEKCHYSSAGVAEPPPSSGRVSIGEASSDKLAHSGSRIGNLDASASSISGLGETIPQESQRNLGVSHPTREPDGTIEHADENIRSYMVPSAFAFTERLESSIKSRNNGHVRSIAVPVPMANAPLFSPPAPSGQEMSDDIDHDFMTLPSRREADSMVKVYWTRLHWLNPILDKPSFTSSIEALYNGSLTSNMEKIFLGKLNLISALVTQSQEDLASDQRQSTSTKYFTRAHNLVRAEAILGGNPCIDMVEYLLLKTVYLQCIGDPHQTWMALGSAIRIAQSLNLHSADHASHTDTASTRKRSLWSSCIFADRHVSTILGRPYTIQDDYVALAVAQHRQLYHENSSIEEFEFDPNHIIRSLELYTFISQITPIPSPQRLSHLGSAHKSSLMKDDSEDYIFGALRLEGQIEKWEKSFPISLIWDSKALTPSTQPSKIWCYSAHIQLRIAHSRIMLLRPMLAYLCLPRRQGRRNTSSSTIREQSIYNCASNCVSNATHILSIVQHFCHQDVSNTYSIPWWQRCYYLHVAATTFITASMSPDLSVVHSISENWNNCMSALETVQYLSPILPKYMGALKTLSAELLQTPEENSTVFSGFEEVFDSFDPLISQDDLYSSSLPFSLNDIFFTEHMISESMEEDI